MENKNSYVVITGASSGIGYATAQAFANRGDHLILVARRHEHLLTLKNEILKTYPMLDVILKVCDLSHPPAVYQLYEELKTYRLKTWINNAGFGDYSTVTQQNLSKITDMLHVNIEALTILSTLFTQDYYDIAGTQLINVSSRGGDG